MDITGAKCYVNGKNCKIGTKKGRFVQWYINQFFKWRGVEKCRKGKKYVSE